MPPLYETHARDQDEEDKLDYIPQQSFFDHHEPIMNNEEVLSSRQILSRQFLLLLFLLCFDATLIFVLWSQKKSMFRIRRDPKPSESNAIPSPGFHRIRRIPVGSDKILYWIRWDPSMGLFDLGWISLQH
ncbi:unnamed protein product [Adineta ricciae]|uniref:Uncharacterized protein n=1 Tax=Adineta ricciae TaxID=249248 RepID=A0A813RY56_ADIRI|nr:unnamed protein product [Adineta ricciae]